MRHFTNENRDAVLTVEGPVKKVAAVTANAGAFDVEIDQPEADGILGTEINPDAGSLIQNTITLIKEDQG